MGLGSRWRRWIGRGIDFLGERGGIRRCCSAVRVGDRGSGRGVGELDARTISGRGENKGHAALTLS